MPLLGVNAKISKKINRDIVLKTIYNYKPISRAEIAKIIGLTSASITMIINEFLNIGLVKEVNKVETSSGRKPILVDIDKESFYVIGVSISRKKVVAILANMDSEIIEEVSVCKNIFKNQDFIHDIIKLINLLINKNIVIRNKIIGIGMAVPGPINAKKGEIFNKQIKKTPPFSWEMVPLKDEIYKEFKIPVFVDNCDNVSAIGESWFGSGMNFKNFVYVSFGEGVGGGLILNGRLYGGEDDIVGEIGHMTIDPNGLRCECGNYGCLELFVKNENILKKFNEFANKNLESQLSKLTINKVEDIYNYQDKSDLIYQEITQYLTKYLSVGVINIINLLNPEAVIIGTNDLEEIDLDIIVNKISVLVKSRAYPVVKNKVKVLSSILGSRAPLVGSISLVIREFFALETQN